VPEHSGIQQLINFPLGKLREYIDWTPFFSAWELRAKYPRVLQHESYGEEARKLFADAEQMLNDWIVTGKVGANAVFGLFPANSVDNDDIEIYLDELRDEASFKVIGLRQQTPHPGDRSNLSLADYIAPRDSGVCDYIGAFAVTAGIGLEQLVADYEQVHDVYNAMLAKALADRLAEAFTEYLHHQIRTETWGYASNEALDQAEIIKEQYRGIRPAPGYPANPDHQQKLLIWDLLKAEQATGISLTESLAMWPASSVSGWYFSHPKSEYFAVGKIDQDQVVDYSRRALVSLATAEQNLAPNLGYQSEAESEQRVA
jgi:5-methyltetrahydrofolate--homocysteine methyltransferase